MRRSRVSGQDSVGVEKGDTLRIGPDIPPVARYVAEYSWEVS